MRRAADPVRVACCAQSERGPPEQGSQLAERGNSAEPVVILAAPVRGKMPRADREKQSCLARERRSPRNAPDPRRPECFGGGTARARSASAAFSGKPAYSPARTSDGATGASGSAAGASRGAAGSSGSAAGASGGAAGGGGATEHFRFFVASWTAMQRVSKSPNGFGGDLRYGAADGLSGADEICREIAATAMAGAGAKVWRAFLSVTKGADGKAVTRSIAWARALGTTVSSASSQRPKQI